MTATLDKPAATARFLTLVLRLDALATAAVGALLLAGSRMIDEPLGIPVAHSRGLGIFLLAWAVFVGFVSTRPTGALVKLVIGVNLFWVLDSVVYAVAEDRLTALGVAFTLVQAAAVTGFAALQIVGLRKART